MSDLDIRKKNVLRWIVQSYIENATPVGSSHLVKKYRIQYSPATVRNEMAELEELGYIKQPHTSAGRIPTDRGYRTYVDRLMKSNRLSAEECEQIHSRMEEMGMDVNALLEEVSRILGVISHELSVVLTPWISWGIFDRLEFVALTGRKVLVVLHVQTRLVKTVILELESDLDTNLLEKTASIINERLSGLTLEEIKKTIEHRIKDTSFGDRALIDQMVDASDEIFDFSEPLKVHTCGTQNFLGQPEFTDITMMAPILTLLDDRRKLAQLFRHKVSETQVTIGQENTDERLKSFTMVSACYRRGKDVGALGVIGPTRMSYSKILPLVSYTASAMTDYLS